MIIITTITFISKDETKFSNLFFSRNGIAIVGYTNYMNYFHFCIQYMEEIRERNISIPLNQFFIKINKTKKLAPYVFLIFN